MHWSPLGRKPSPCEASSTATLGHWLSTDNGHWLFTGCHWLSMLISSLLGETALLPGEEVNLHLVCQFSE